MRRAPPVSLSPVEREELDAWASGRTATHRLALRAQVILAAADGSTNLAIARQLGVHPETVTRWRHRFSMNRLEGLRRDAPRSGDRTRVPPTLVDRIVRMTADEPPPNGSRWTTRSLARALQVNHMLVHRVWKAHGVAPPTRGTAVLPPLIEAGVWVDVLGAFVGTPTAALVFGVGPLRDPVDEPPAHPRMDPDRSGGYRVADHRGGPPSLSGLLAGIEKGLPPLADARRSPHELLVFLRGLEEITGPSTELHVIFDRPLELLSGRLASWLRVHPRFRVLAVSPSGSWSAAVDDWVRSFRDIPLHPKSFEGVAGLADALRDDGPPGRQRRLAWTIAPGFEVDRDSRNPPLPGARPIGELMAQPELSTEPGSPARKAAGAAPHRSP